MYSMCATHFYSVINISTHIIIIIIIIIIAIIIIITIIIISYFHNFVCSQVRPAARISQLLAAKQQKDLEAKRDQKIRKDEDKTKPDQKIRKDEDKTKEKESCDDKVLTHKRTKNSKEDARKDNVEKIEAKAKIKEDTASEKKTKECQRIKKTTEEEEPLKKTKEEGKFITFISNRL